MPKNHDECIRLLQEAISLLSASRDWGVHAHVRAQKLGLQGEKRRARYEERKDLCLMQHLQGIAVDIFDEEIFPAAANTTFPQINQIPEYFAAYQAKLWETYEELHAIANDLVVKGYKPIAAPIYDYAEYLWCDILDIRRQIKEGVLAEWEYHHVSRYQVGIADGNRHDEYEKMEKKQGYKY